MAPDSQDDINGRSSPIMPVPWHSGRAGLCHAVVSDVDLCHSLPYSQREQSRTTAFREPAQHTSSYNRFLLGEALITVDTHVAKVILSWTPWKLLVSRLIYNILF